MTIWQSVILGIVEALTEFLPVSSTAHLILASKLMGMESSSFLSSFEIIIQLGAILAVAIIFAKEVWSNKKMWAKIIWAFIPTAVLGFLAYKVVKEYLLQGQLITGIVLILGGIMFIIWEKFWFKETKTEGKEIDDLTNIQAGTVGGWQALAFIPGMSRSAVSTLGGMVAGLKKSEAVKFAFILAVPTMVAASGYDALKTGIDMWQGEIAWLTGSEIGMLVVGLIVTFIVAMLTVKFFTKLMSKKNSFIYFGIYRVLIGIVWLFLFWS